jgi:hypothetical protein
MSKKQQKKKSDYSENKSKKPILLIIGAVIVGFFALLVSRNIVFSGSDEKKGKSFYIKESETRPVLDPSQFTGQARAAYAAAKKYPEVMNQVFCYCYCNAPPFKHKTLLSCFTDKHGAG